MSEIKIPVECYTRVVGYYRPDSQANIGKRAEISERKLASVRKIKEKLHSELNMKGRLNGQI